MLLTIHENPFIVQNPGLLITKGNINCNKVNSLIDTGCLDFGHKSKLYAITAREFIENVSLNAIVNDYNHGCPMFSVIIQNKVTGNNLKKHEDISKVLSEYTYAFPDQLHEGLPPKHAEEDLQVKFNADT